jgi:hypothetical protein
MIQGSGGGRPAQVAGNRSIGFGVTGYGLLYTPRSAPLAGIEGPHDVRLRYRLWYFGYVRGLRFEPSV